MKPICRATPILAWVGLGLHLTIVGVSGAPALPAPQPPPAFALDRWPAGETVRLSDFAGQIVVLDFFAHWCAPCLPASRELESGVQRFYGARGGNPQGIPVRVLSVNIEPGFRAETDSFIRRSGASLVATDPAGALLERLGGAGLPFLVILDGSTVTNGTAGFKVIYRRAGFEGVGALRRIIDGLGVTSEPRLTGLQKPRSAAGFERPVGSNGEPVGPPALRAVEAEVEVLGADDLLLTESKGGYREERGRTEWSLAYSYASFAERYRPFRLLDFFGYDEDLFADRHSLQGEIRQQVAERFTAVASAALYTGYPNYRRVWIANRYRQKYDHPDFARVPGYEEPDPQGARGSLGVRWEYWATQGFAELRLGYARDQTAPGYEDGTDAYGNFRLIQGRERLDTKRLSFSSENVVTARIRVLNEIGFTRVTDRELRFAYKGSANLALAERWFLRAEGGVTTESPSFDAWFVGATLEWELWPSLQLSVSGRHYVDSGEIESSLPITSAAPPLRVWQAGLSLRWVGPYVALKISAGPIVSDHDHRRGIGEEFTYLYADRKWGLAQAAVDLSF